MGVTDRASFESLPVPVLVSVLPRALFVGFVGAGTVAMSIVLSGLPITQVTPAVFGLVFAGIVSLILGLAYVGYSRRRYECTPDGIIETTWVFGTKQTQIPYDEITNITFHQSLVQSLFGVGTIRINEITLEEQQNLEQMRIRYIETPGLAYSTIRRAVADDQDSPVDISTDAIDDVARTDSFISMDSTFIARDTSSSYHMPVAIIHPSTLSATRGAITDLLILAPLLYLPVGTLYALVQPSNIDFVSFYLLLAGPVIGVVITSHLLKTYYAQMELYQDHLRVIRYGLYQKKKTSIQYEDISQLESSTRLLSVGDIGKLTLTDTTTNTDITLSCIRKPAAVKETIERLMNAQQ